MANYMKDTVHVSEFRNTNIIGDGDKWSNYSNSSFILLPSTNLGLIGDYYINNMHNQNFDSFGVFDIVGGVPAYLGMAHEYVNLWGTVLRETEVSPDIKVIYLHGSGGEYIKASDYVYNTSASVVISKKYNDNLSTNAAVYKPYHRAFVNAAGKVKLTGSDLSGIDAKYLGSDSTKPVPSLDEADWITAANNGTTPANLADNYVGLSSDYKWNSAEDFNTNANAAE